MKQNLIETTSESKNCSDLIALFADTDLIKNKPALMWNIVFAILKLYFFSVFHCNILETPMLYFDAALPPSPFSFPYGLVARISISLFF